jgi:hypothetical protein
MAFALKLTGMLGLCLYRLNCPLFAGNLLMPLCDVPIHKIPERSLKSDQTSLPLKLSGKKRSF